MHFKTILEAVRRQPFQPFILQMNDRREFFIRHPELITVTPREVTVINLAMGETVYLETFLIASMHTKSKPDPDWDNPSATAK